MRTSQLDQWLWISEGYDYWFNKGLVNSSKSVKEIEVIIRYYSYSSCRIFDK